MGEVPLLKIDELTLPDHYFLNTEDSCWYFHNYVPRAGFGHSKENQLIWNFKKPMDRKGRPEWKYKVDAIEQVALLLKHYIDLQFDQVTIVPIPPSKCKTDPDYDDRVAQVLQKAWGDVPNADIRELLESRKTREAAHLAGDNRPPIREHEQNLELQENQCANIKPHILLFDDVVITGAQYVACKNVLRKRFPDVQFIGLFIARAQRLP